MHPELFCKPCRQRTSKIRLNFTANNFVFGRKYHENALRTFFYKPCKAKMSNMRLNFIANIFIFGHKSLENAPRTFVVNFANGELLKCVWTSQETFFVCGHINQKNAPRTFLQTLQVENFQNASELHSKQFRFWMHKSWKHAQNFFWKPCKRRTSKMRELHS